MLTALFFLFPMVSSALFLANENQFHFGFIFLFVLCGIIGFFLLKYSLWNTFGKEILAKRGNDLVYVSDYGWFKDKVKNIVIQESLTLNVAPHFKDGNFKLWIVNSDTEEMIETAVPIQEIEAIKVKEALSKMIDTNKSFITA